MKTQVGPITGNKTRKQKNFPWRRGNSAKKRTIYRVNSLGQGIPDKKRKFRNEKKKRGHMHKKDAAGVLRTRRPRRKGDDYAARTVIGTKGGPLSNKRETGSWKVKINFWYEENRTGSVFEQSRPKSGLLQKDEKKTIAWKDFTKVRRGWGKRKPPCQVLVIRLFSRKEKETRKTRSNIRPLRTGKRKEGPG